MRKVVCIADNILSPLGRTSEENYRAVLHGKSGVAKHSDDLAEDFFASLTDHKNVLRIAEEMGIDSSKFTYFELMWVISATDAIANAAALLYGGSQCYSAATGLHQTVEAKEKLYEASRGSSAAIVNQALRNCSLPLDRTQLILSTTKGNISLSLNNPDEIGDKRLLLHHSAEVINSHFGFALPPVVISNACISGVCAEIEALRRIRAGLCDYAVVVGCDEQSRFIVSGFQSFKALAPEPCRPFDANRKGLNLGEAAATVVLAAEECLSKVGSPTCADKTYKPDDAIRHSDRYESGDKDEKNASLWEIVDGAIRNDANHISGPSRTGEGSYRALKYVIDSPLWNDCQDMSNVVEQIAVVNAHGTATAYNDEMESIAIDRAGMSAVPVNSLKGYFGHTMGAAGILETIITMHATAEGVLLPTKGYSECGVSHPLNISSEVRTTEKRSFIKLISGFGGCNAAIGFRLTQLCHQTLPPDSGHIQTYAHESGVPFSDIDEDIAAQQTCIEHSSALAADQTKFTPIAEASVSAGEDLAEAYRSLGCEYPKFFKMDPLCKTGYIASERLLRHTDTEDQTKRIFSELLYGNEDTAIVLMNRSASLCNDLHYCRTIVDKEHYFPSPALFVYTLPNIVTGEIAIRNKLYGESIFYICDSPAIDDISLDSGKSQAQNTTETELGGIATKETPKVQCRVPESIQKRILEAVQLAFQDRSTQNVMAGWVEASPAGQCEAKVYLFRRNHKA